MFHKTILTAAILLLAVACGSDDPAPNNTTGTNNVRDEDSNRSPNNTSSNTTGTNNTASTNNASTNNATTTNNSTSTNNATNNATSTNNTTGNNTTGGAVVEMEPNDDRANANNVVLGDSISGTAESGGGEDVFAFTAPAGTILELEFLAAERAPDVAIFVEDASDDVGDRAIDLLPGGKRQFFLPTDDIWYVSVRSFDVVDRNYEIALRAVTPAPITEAFSATVVGDLNDRAVDVYELPDANGVVQASLVAERLATSSELDSVMYVYSPNAGLVTFNDDSTSNATTDSELDFNAAAGETYWLVVDAWRHGSNNPYELDVVLP